MKLSVVIVNYNVRYFLEQCLHAVRKSSDGLACEVFVVDNNSVDGSCQMVREKFPEVILIENKENVGFSRANNQAIRQSSGEYILLLNPDTVVEEDSFRKIIAFMDATPDAGGLGVKMIDGKGNFLPESKRGLPTPMVAFYKIFGFRTCSPAPKNSTATTWVISVKTIYMKWMYFPGRSCSGAARRSTRLACSTKIISCTAKISTFRTVSRRAATKTIISPARQLSIIKAKAPKKAASTT
jgi:GT2 family glycosyltransferase